jgi:endonuclease/exonuclease/phosphatase family metal-dependent hydrolase
VTIDESRRLQHARIRMRASSCCTAGAVSCALDLWNAHLEVQDERVRFLSLQRIADEMDSLAGQGSIGTRAHARTPTRTHDQCKRDRPAASAAASASADASAMDGSSHPPLSSSSDQLLVGDLNAMSRLDYTPAECQYQSRVDRFHLGTAAAHSVDPWRCMDFAEDEQKWLDAFTKDGVERPKISVWICRRVDHALLYRGCAWSVARCLQVFTQASDHLPLFLVLQPPQPHHHHHHHHQMGSPDHQ